MGHSGGAGGANQGQISEEDIRIVKAKDKRHDKGRCVAKEKKTPAATSDAGPSN